MIIEVLRDLVLEDAAIVAMLEDRVWPVELPDAPTYPALVITKVAGPSELDLAGPVALERARIQMDIHGDAGMHQVLVLTQLVKRLFHGFKGGLSSAPCQIDQMACINDFDLTEPATERAGPRVRRRTLEFYCWNREV